MKTTVLYAYKLITIISYETPIWVISTYKLIVFNKSLFNFCNSVSSDKYIKQTKYTANHWVIALMINHCRYDNLL